MIGSLNAHGQVTAKATEPRAAIATRALTTRLTAQVVPGNACPGRELVLLSSFLSASSGQLVVHAA